MKKKQKKLSLEKFNIARLTVNTHYIFGGDRPKDTDRCTTTTTNTTTNTHTSNHTSCSTDPQSNSSLECLVDNDVHSN